jgi:hypothetical protein
VAVLLMGVYGALAKNVYCSPAVQVRPHALVLHRVLLSAPFKLKLGCV